MRKKIIGIFCLMLTGVAIGIGLAAIASESIPAGMLYIGILIGGALLVSYSYCTKCSVRLLACGHVFVGQMTRILPARVQTNYTVWDVLGIMVAFGAMLGFPQYWLWQHTVWLILFWALALASVVGNCAFVCKNCDNAKCLLCPKYRMAKQD